MALSCVNEARPKFPEFISSVVWGQNEVSVDYKRNMHEVWKGEVKQQASLAEVGGDHGMCCSRMWRLICRLTLLTQGSPCAHSPHACQIFSFCFLELECIHALTVKVTNSFCMPPASLRLDTVRTDTGPSLSSWVPQLHIHPFFAPQSSDLQQLQPCTRHTEAIAFYWILGSFPIVQVQSNKPCIPYHSQWYCFSRTNFCLSPHEYKWILLLFSFLFFLFSPFFPFFEPAHDQYNL